MTSYEWGEPGATALVLPFPEAERLIGTYRRAHTPSGGDGMVAHATLLAPFVHVSALSEEDLEALRTVLSRFRAFHVELRSFARFDDIGVLYLEPEPPEPVVIISEALLDAFPQVEYPPAGATEIVPHVTVVSRLPREELDRIEAELAPKLPVAERAERVLLMERSAHGGWLARVEYPLVASSPPAGSR